MAAAAPLSASRAGATLRTATAVLPMHADEPCGDAAVVLPCPALPSDAAPRWLLAIVDGLGHGLEAAIAAQAAVDLLTSDPALPLQQQFARLEDRLSTTRGAAVGLVQVSGDGMLHAGIGNTRALLLRGDELRRLPSLNGIVGGGHALQLSLNHVALQPGDWLMLFTDGIDERVQFPLQLPEWRRDPATLCDHLLARWKAGRDDAGVLVALVDA